jgi:hypothetical protein
MMSKPPSKLKMAINLAKAAGRAVSYYLENGHLEIEEEEFNDRIDICAGSDGFDSEPCEEYYIDEAGHDRCSNCGCYLEEKARLASEYCPLYKWPGDVLKAEVLDHEEKSDEGP